MKKNLGCLLNKLVTRYNYFFCIILIIACGKQAEVTEQDPASLRGQVPPTEVRVIKAVKKPFEYLIKTSGKIEADKDLDIVIKVDGTINQLAMKNGDLVKSGQLLASLDNQRYKLDLDKAEIFLKEKKISYDCYPFSFYAWLARTNYYGCCSPGFIVTGIFIILCI